MFQTEPIHALQTLASDGMTSFMVGITTLGYAWMLIPILLVIAFGFDFRRGFVLVQAVAWTGLMVDVLKTSFGLPRPEAVDSTLLQPGDPVPEIAPFERMGAPGFWEPLPPEVVAHYRGKDVSYGLPSGHCAVTTVMWGSTAALFRRRWLWALALVLIALMPLSRMYLARHFLADVLGGLAVGAIMLGIAHSLAIGPLVSGRRPWWRRSPALSPETLGTLFYLGAPLPMLLLPGAELESVLRLLGINLGLWLLTRSGLPLDESAPSKVRLARVLLAFALYLLSDRALTAALEALLGESDLLAAAIQGLSAFVLVWGTTLACYRLGLYRRGAPAAGLLVAPRCEAETAASGTGR